MDRQNGPYVAPGSDILARVCPRGHEIRVSEYVWTRFDRHGCAACGRTYTVRELPPSVKAKLEESWSDRNRVAKILYVRLLQHYYSQINLDRKSQRDYALEIGVIAGSSSTVDEALERFIALAEEE